MSSGSQDAALPASARAREAPEPLGVTQPTPGEQVGAGAETAGAGRAYELAREPDAAARDRAARLAEAAKAVSVSSTRARGDLIVFAIFLLAGFAAIFTLKSYGVDPHYVAALAVASMVAYAMISWLFPKVSLRPDRLGDNVYYMGFVYTLASMSAALVDLQAGADVNTLIGSFGIALFSTIAGIAIRVLFQQARTETEDIEQIVRQDLLDQAYRLRAQMVAAANDLESFRLLTSERINGRLKASLDDHEKASAAHLRAIEGLVGGLLERLGATFDTQNSLLMELNDATGQSVEALRGVTKRFAAIRPPEDIVERKLDKMFVGMASVVDAFEKTAQSEIERQNAMSSAANALTATVELVGSEIARIRRQVEDLGQIGVPAERLGASLTSLKERVDTLANGIGAQDKALGEIAQMSQQWQVALRSELDATRGVVDEQSKSVLAAASAVGRGAKDLTEQLDAVTRSISEQRAVMQAAASDTERARQQISADLDASRTAVIEVQRALAATGRAIASAIAGDQADKP